MRDCTQLHNDTVVKDRENYIGGSDIPVILNKSKFKKRYQLIQEYINYGLGLDTYKPYSTVYTQYGHYMEDKIRQYINIQYDYDFKASTKIFEDKKIRCNCDGLDISKNTLLEIKTTSKISNASLLTYELQIQLYLWAFDCEECILAVYKRPSDFFKGIFTDTDLSEEYFDLSFDNKNLAILNIKRNDRLINYILNSINNFWEEINNGIKEHTK